MGGASLKIIQSFSFENIVLALENTV
jgi:hypothetical protein